MSFVMLITEQKIVDRCRMLVLGGLCGFLLSGCALPNWGDDEQAEDPSRPSRGVGGMATGVTGVTGVMGGGACSPSNWSDPDNVPTRGKPVELGSTVSGCITNEQSEYYQFSSPPSPLDGGYARVHFRDVSLNVELGIRAALAETNDTLFTGGSANAGATLTVFWGMGADTAFRLAVRPVWPLKSEFAEYTMETSWTPFADPHEPNQERESATPIDVGEPIEALYAWGPAGNQSAPSSFIDWYAVELVAGDVLVELTDCHQTSEAT
jgi:hypothetical protein